MEFLQSLIVPTLMFLIGVVVGYSTGRLKAYDDVVGPILSDLLKMGKDLAKGPEETRYTINRKR